MAKPKEPKKVQQVKSDDQFAMTAQSNPGMLFMSVLAEEAVRFGFMASLPWSYWYVPPKS